MVRRQVTTRSGTIKLAGFVSTNKSAFEGKSKQAVKALIEATFPGEFFSDATIAEILSANNIAVARRNKGPFHKTDRSRIIAKLLQSVINKLSEDLGAVLLSADDKEKLSKIIGGHSLDEG